MKKFLLKLTVFLMPILFLVVLVAFNMEKILSINNGPSTRMQIKKQFEDALIRDYEMLILGNSRTYRGINPEFLDIEAYNFSHDNDSFNQMYFKLKHLLSNGKKPNFCLLGIDYFQFSFISDTRNYAYCDYFDESYLEDYDIKDKSKLKFNYYKSNFDFSKIKLAFGSKNKPSLRDNGQYIKPGIVREDDSIKRDISILDIQNEYFNKFINLCRLNNIEVVFVMLPLRKAEYNSYLIEEIDQFHELISKSIEIPFLDYSKNDLFSIKDYTDITHLNENAANRFTRMLNEDLKDIVHN